MATWHTITCVAAIGFFCACWPAAAHARRQHRVVDHATAHERHRGAEPRLGWHRGAEPRLGWHRGAEPRLGWHIGAEPRRGWHIGAAHPGHLQRGAASIYAMNLRGRRMADGTPFNPASNAAASKTLPLGTVVRVTNLKNHRSTLVRVRDHGPYKPGRILDLSPKSAGVLGMTREGVAPVAIVPLRATGAR